MAPRSDEIDFNKACTELVRAAISVMPSVLERLIYLASLKDRNTGEYQDQVLEGLLALKFGKPETDSDGRGEQVIGLRRRKAELDRALQHEHLAIFEDWLCLNLRQQLAQLEYYASRHGIPSRTLSGEWIHEKSYERLTPSDAMPSQRRLFLTDLETVLTILSWGESQ
jgi:hypothetical protein